MRFATRPLFRHGYAFLSGLLLLGLAATGLRAQEPGVRHLVINELAPANQPDHAIEIYNYGPTQAMNGWVLQYKTSASGATITYVFPGAFILPRHALVIVHFGPGTNTATDLFSGNTEPFSNSGGEVLLRDGTNNKDFMKFGSPVVPTIKPADLPWIGPSVAWPDATVGLARQRDANTWSADDWAQPMPPNDGPTPGQLNSKQIGTRLYSPILVNEFSKSTGGVELYNPNTFPVNVNGLQIRGGQGLGDATQCQLLTLGPGTILAGGFITQTLNLCTAGWGASNPGSIRLRDPVGNEWDAIGFNHGGDLVMNNVNVRAFRKSDIPTGSYYEWTVNNTALNLGALNPGQIGAFRYDELGTVTSPSTPYSGALNSGSGMQVNLTRSLTFREIRVRMNTLATSAEIAIYRLTGAPNSWTRAAGPYALTPLQAGEQVYTTGAIAIPPKFNSPDTLLVMVFANAAFTLQEAPPAERFSYGNAAGVNTHAAFPSPAGPIAMTGLDTTKALHFYFWSAPAPAVQPETATLKPGELNCNYLQQFSSPFGAAPITWTSNALPSGLSFNAPSQQIVGTPTVSGTFPNIQITATDNVVISDTNTYTLDIYTGVQWNTLTPLPEGEVGLAYNLVLSASGGPPGGYSWSVAPGPPLPGGLILGGVTGQITGSPTTAGANQAFALRVTDSIGCFKDLSATLTIHPQVQVSTAALPGADQGSSYNASLASTGGAPGGRNWTITSGSLPPGITLSGPTGSLTGPVTASPSLYNFTVQVTDPLGAIATRGLSIQVFPPLDITTAALPDGEEHIAYSQNLTATGGNGVYSWSAQSGLPGFCTFSTAGSLNCADPTPPGPVSLNVRLTDTAGGQVDRLFNFQFVAPPVITTAALGDGEVNAAYNQTMAATGGIPPYTWSGSSLPTGLSISPAGVITGNPSVAGTFNGVNIIVTDNLGGVTSKIFNNVVIHPQLQVSTASLPGIDQGSTYNFTLQSSGGAPGPRNWSILSGSLPAGVSLDGPTGALTGTATAPPGPYFFTVQVTGVYGPANRGLSIQVYPPLVNNTASMPDGEVGIAYNQALSATGGNGPYTWTAQAGLPAFCTFSSGGLFSCANPPSPTAVAFTARLTDTAGGLVDRIYNFQFVAAPVISTATLSDGEMSVAYNLTMTVTGGIAPYSWGGSGLPTGLTISTAGVITGNPSAAGTYNGINISVTDNLGGVTSKIFNNVVIHPQLQVSTASLPGIDQGSTYNFTLQSSGGAPGPRNWSILSGNLPAGVSLDGPTGALTGTATAPPGPYFFTVQVTGVYGPANRGLSIQVYPPLVNNTASLPNGEVSIAYNQTLMASGGNGPYTWTAQAGLPAFCTFSSGGLFSCANPPSPTAVAFTARLTDTAGGLVDRIYNFQFVAAPDITTATLNTGEVNAPYNQTLSVSGGAPPFIWSGASLPPGLSISAAGVITGMPTAAGTYNGVTITVNDGPGGTAQKVFNGVVILPAVRITTPPGPLGPAEVNIPFGPVNLTWADGQGPMTFSLDFGSLPAGISLSAGGTIAGTPTVAGGYSIIIRITDALGGTDVETFSINVSVPPVIVNTSLPKGVVQVAYPNINLLAQGGVPPYSYSVFTGTLPTGITFNTTTGQFGGTPTTVGGGPITFRVTDSLGGFVNKVLGIQVIDPPLPTDWSRRAQFSGGVGQIVLAPGYHSVNKPVAYVTADQGGELFRTVDRGFTWQSFLVDNNNSGAPIHTLRMSPNFAYNTGTGIFSGSLFVSTGAGGVYQSTDGGAIFASRNTGLPNLLSPDGPKTSALAISPNFASDATAWVVAQVGAQTKLYRSTTQPENWSDIFTFPAGLTAGVAQLEASPNFSVDNTLFALYDGRIFRSTSGGTSWSQVYDPLTGKLTRILFSPNYAVFPAIFAENETRVFYRSLDGGTTWEQLTIQGYNLAFGDNGAGGLALYFKSPGGTYGLVKSEDRGTTFVPVYARGMQPAGPTTGPAFHSALAVGGLSGDIFSGTQAGLTVSNDGGNVFFPRQTGLATIKAASISGKGNFVVAATDGGILRSRDAGLTWIQLQNLKLADNSVIQLPNTSLAAVSPAFNLDKTFFVNVTPNFGTSTQGLYRTIDGGFTFTHVLFQQCRTVVFVPGFDSRSGQPVRTLYAGCFNGLFRSIDGGASFMPLSGATGMDSRCNQSTRTETDGLGLSPRISPPGSYTLYRSGDGGICISNDSGFSWSILLGGGGAPFIGTVSSAPTSADSTTSVDRLSIRTDFITYQIAYSTDGGSIWSCVRTPSLTCLQGIVYARAFFSPNYATDRLALIAVNRTFNGATGNVQGGLYRFDANTGIATPLSGADLLRGRIITGIYMPSTFSGSSGTGVALVTTQGGGLYRSTDSANTFQPITRYDFASPNIRNAARSEGGPLGLGGGNGGKTGPGAEAPEVVVGGGTIFSVGDDGVFASDDSGVTFDDISQGLPDGVAVLSIAAPSGSPSTPVCGVDNSGLYKYDGTQWVQITGVTTGDYTNFSEDDSYLYAIRSDGVSLRGDLTGSNWTTIDNGGTDLQNIAYSNALTLEGGPSQKRYGPYIPQGTTASLWGVSAASGPKFSTTSGATWTTSAGGNDYILPTVSNYQTVTALGIDSVSNARVALVGYNGGLYRTTDGGDTWRSVTGPGSGLESTSKNATAMISSTTSFGTTDVLVGMTGTSVTGGVYLSGDAGEHWTQINSGFDAATLNITTLVKTSCSGCPVQYYSGTYGSGVYTRTIAVSNPPTIPSVNYACWTGTSCSCITDAGSGPEEGGQAFKLCGTNFAALPKVEFDGIPATGCTMVSSTVITCTGTPPHFPGAARVRVRNTDTRAGYLPFNYTYTASSPRVVNTLTVAKSGSNAVLTWTCTGCTAGNPARVYRSQSAGFTTYIEQYDGGTGGTYTNTSAASSAYSYFWNVE